FMFAAPGAALGQDEAVYKAEEVFESLYGRELREASATRDKKDDLALAGKLLDGADAASAQPALVTLLCEKAYALGGSHAAGYATAVEAMEFLAALVPEKAAECEEKILKIRRKQYGDARGDKRLEAGEMLIESLLAVAGAKTRSSRYSEAKALYRKAAATARATRSDKKREIERQTKLLAEAQRISRRIDGLLKRVKENPNNVEVRNELVRLYVVERDAPAEAAKYLNDRCDATLRRLVPAAAEDPAKVKEEAALDLGQWYRSLSGEASGLSKATILKRSGAYYERFLALHKKDDLSRVQATLALRTVRDELESLGDSAPEGFGPGKWIDLLRLVKPDLDAVNGKWKRKGKSLVVEPGKSCRLTIPIAPEGNYELQLKFSMEKLGGSCSVILPVGSARVLLVMAGSGVKLGLVNGAFVRGEKAAAAIGHLQAGRDYTVRIRASVRGDQASISATLDGKPYIKWRGPLSAMRTSWRLHNPKCLGLGTHGTPVVFSSAGLRMLSGKARTLRTWGAKKK
ncbi:MAG: hypothetical protein QF662_06120, partial [Phycisphaerae bacterium]|nr:hypothetical protein [Phycisphaerae bacterium]